MTTMTRDVASAATRGAGLDFVARGCVRETAFGRSVARVDRGEREGGDRLTDGGLVSSRTGARARGWIVRVVVA